jgi:Ca2+-binding EF-hand superfamily protein
MKRVLSFAALIIALGCGAQAFADDDTQAAPDELFKKLDVNGDGKLTASEIPQEHRKFFERLLRIGDTDKNGELTREEFNHALNQTEEPVTDISKVGNLGGGPPARPNLDPKRIFQALDKNKDGKLTRDELADRPRLLALFDRLGKDELTLEDVSAALGPGGKANGKKAKKRAAKLAENAGSKDPQMAADGTDGHQLPAIFRLLDTDHDGRLSPEELSKAGALFEKLDRNHDGFLDAKELTSAPPAGDGEEVAAMPARPLKRVANFRNGQHMLQAIMKADANGDGKISEEEAPPQLKKHFSQIDTNGDGFLDRSEIETWIKRRQKRMGALNDGQNPPAENATPKTPGL